MEYDDTASGRIGITTGLGLGLGLGLPLMLVLAGLVIAFRKWRKDVRDLDQEAQIAVGPKDQHHGSRILCYLTIGMVLILFKFIVLSRYWKALFGLLIVGKVMAMAVQDKRKLTQAVCWRVLYSTSIVAAIALCVLCCA